MCGEMGLSQEARPRVPCGSPRFTQDTKVNPETG